MDALARPIIPPAPKIHQGVLPIWRLMLETVKNSLGNWEEGSFTALLGRRNVAGIDSLLVNDPKWVRHILHANLANYVKPPAMLRPVRPLAGHGVLLAEGAEWKRQRRMLAPAFTPASVNLLLPHFSAAAKVMAERLATTPRVDLSGAFHEAALDAVLRALFSLPADGSSAGLARIVRDYLAGPGRPNIFDGFAQAEGDFAFALLRRRRFQKRWFKAVDAIIATRKAAPAPETHSDLLDLLLAVRDPDTDAPLDDEEVRDQCATMLLAGFETTSRLLFWASYLLTLDPAEQTRLRKEIAAFPPERVQTLEDLQHWPRLKQVLCETLRLYPPVPVMLRKALGPDTIGEYEIGAGTLLWISPWVIHRHREFWDNPTAFMPDRFAGKAAPWVTEPAFLPFSAGPRICIGASFAMAEASIVLATLLSRFELSLDSTRPILPVGGVTTSPDHEPLFSLEAVP